MVKNLNIIEAVERLIQLGGTIKRDPWASSLIHTPENDFDIAWESGDDFFAESDDIIRKDWVWTPPALASVSA